MFKLIKQRFCDHAFNSKDIELTNIPAPEEPKPGAGFEAWQEYFKSLSDHESYTKRIKAKCSKCGKVYFANCGLDLLKHGQVNYKD